jgi:hypothetical protein
MRHYREETPLLDTEFEMSDSYMSELEQRISAARSSNARKHALQSWLN